MYHNWITFSNSGLDGRMYLIGMFLLAALLGLLCFRPCQTGHGEISGLLVLAKYYTHERLMGPCGRHKNWITTPAIGKFLGVMFPLHPPPPP
jgi:hypothetical protein